MLDFTCGVLGLSHGALGGMALGMALVLGIILYNYGRKATYNHQAWRGESSGTGQG